MAFCENKGQESNQYGKPRPDVLFSESVMGMVYHLKDVGISYQLNRIDSRKEEENTKIKATRKVPDQQTVYRMGINWLNCNVSIPTGSIFIQCLKSGSLQTVKLIKEKN